MGDSEDSVHPGGLRLYVEKSAGRRRGVPKSVKSSIEKKLEAEQRSRNQRSVLRAGIGLLSAAVFKMSRGSGKGHPTVLKSIKRSIKYSANSHTISDLAKETGVEYGLWLDENAHPILMYRDLVRMYGQEWLSWEPETLWSEIEEDEELVRSIPRGNRDKIMALRTAIRTDIPWNHHEVFENVALGLTGYEARFDIIQSLNTYQIAFALDVMSRIHPTLELSDEVIGYIAATLAYNGLVYAPADMFGPVQEVLDRSSRDDGRTRDAIKKAWDDKKEPDEARIDVDPVDHNLDRLHAVQEFLDMMDGHLGLTESLPGMFYDAEKDETLPDLPEPGLSAPARSSSSPA